MNLSRYTLKYINKGVADVPDASLFELPERVLQFGTGVLLRGLPDYFIDKANRQGLFNGRVVVVKSTGQGDSSAFEKQDGLYTVCVRGVSNGQNVEENIINASISRVLNAQEQWSEVLECAHNAQLQIIVSNTTEVGIQLVEEDIRQHPPKSFPGKLLAFLYERFKAFGGSPSGGLVVIPTELIPDNGKKLESIVLELAHLNGLEDEFIGWIEQHNRFCNSLVDRIVPGRPDKNVQAEIEARLGYSDDLLIMTEAYRLWAIEGGKEVRDLLSFAGADKGVIVEENIDIYRELKLRLLNGTHTLSCGLAFLSGCQTVKVAMEDEMVATYIKDLMLQELAPAIPYPVDAAQARDFGLKVLDRFRNPHLNHLWISITMQYSSKMKMRCIPVLLRHYEEKDTVPQLFALGFAAYLFFTRPVVEKDGKYYGENNGAQYPIQDDMAERFYKRWQQLSPSGIVNNVLGDEAYWGTDLRILPGLEESVSRKLLLMMQEGARSALASEKLPL